MGVFFNFRYNPVHKMLKQSAYNKENGSETNEQKPEEGPKLGIE